jgi:protein phosphatase
MVVRLMPYKIEAFGRSDIGLVRQNNEDVWGQIPELNFFALADGMGGHKAGEVAARLAVNSLCQVVKKKMSLRKEGESFEKMEQMLRRAILHVNAHIYKTGQADRELSGMGTTLCCLLFLDKKLVYAHVGDSRIYRFRNQKLQQMTKDHSLLRELIDQGRLNLQQANDFLYKNIITMAMGTEPTVDPAVEMTDLLPGDLYLMCTDGLSDALSMEQMEQILLQAPTVQSAANLLIDSANSTGGRDNITVVLAKVLQEHE